MLSATFQCHMLQQRRTCTLSTSATKSQLKDCLLRFPSATFKDCMVGFRCKMNSGGPGADDETTDSPFTWKNRPKMDRSNMIWIDPRNEFKLHKLWLSTCSGLRISNLGHNLYVQLRVQFEKGNTWRKLYVFVLVEVQARQNFSE